MLNLISLGKMPKEVKFVSSPIGKKDKITYKYVYEEKHHCPRRVVSGKYDLDEMIQQYADDVDFKAIGQMLVDTRDNVRGHFDLNGETMDVTGLPRNIHEMAALHNKMQDEFAKLPEEMKALFGNDFSIFSNSWQTGQIGAVLDTYYKSKTQEVTGEGDAK